MYVFKQLDFYMSLCPLNKVPVKSLFPWHVAGPHVQHLIPCPPNDHRCWGTHECIPLANVCDTVHNCDYSSDEFGCANNKCK